MLEIFKRDEFNGKLKIIAEFNSFEELFRRLGFSRIDLATIFGYSDVDRHNDHPSLGDHQRPSQWDWWPSRKYCYVAYDNGKFVTPDRLVGLYRDWMYDNRINWRRRWTQRYDRGQKKSAWGRIRHMHTQHEKRWQDAWDDEEFVPKYRAKRHGHNLPDTWDDYWVRGQKSWKYQSKRKHQWKEKK